TLCKLTRNRDDVGVMVVSRENYFTFWPMLAGVISSDVQTHNVAQPLRRALIRLGASFRRATLDGVDPDKRIVTADGREFPYEHLVLALGAEPAYFGIPGVEEHCISIRGIDAGERISNRVIERYEEAALEGGDAPDSKLTFVVIGGGATGVEVASELHSLVHDLLVPDYPNINPHRVKIVLVDANEEILKELDPALRRVARKKLADLRVEVLNNVRAQEVTAEKVVLNDGREIAAQNVIWTAGARASVKLDDLPFPHDERKGLEVDRFMRVVGYENVWGIGDSAANVDERGEPVPPNAQAAVQEGEVVAKNVLAAIDGRELKPFKYKPLGQLVEMGSEFAVNEVMGIKFSGFIAALFWRATYLYKLESPNSRVRIAVDWLLDLFYDPPVTQIRRQG
ncbi:MAG: NAD(P)/FAD-dependent oxidoreductase, partial [Actinomycetota bacterium]|nr:NAD(P)/FAD-dependent oxidoreductase [Actinomycetota bacterium]